MRGLATSSVAVERTLGIAQATHNGPIGAYVHLPFCRRRCFYCDFPVHVVGDKPPDEAAAKYAHTLTREILATPVSSSLGAPKLASLYFGGGTPSLTPPPIIASLVRTIDARFGLAADAEVTLEADPGTFDSDKLARYVEAGVTRVSLGVQSFDDSLLTAAGRAHSLHDVEAALELLQGTDAGRSLALSIDLIGGLPHQTMDTWRSSLAAAASCGAGHISVYDLQVEPGTAFGKWYTPGSAPLPSEELAADMFAEASASLRAAGFEHYEISSYARPGARSRHNGAYWRNAPFLGFGLGATSFLGSVRFARPRRMREYGKWVARLEERGLDAEHSASGTVEPVGGLDALQTELMLALRTADGVDLVRLAHAYPTDGLGEAAAVACVRAARARAEWLVLEPDESHVRLSDPQGMLFSNDAIAHVFAALDDCLRLERAR